MIYSERRTFDEYCLVKESYKNQKDKGRANAYAEYLNSDVKKGLFYFINDKTSPNTVAQDYFNNINGKKVLSSSKTDISEDVEVVNVKQKEFYKYLSIAEVIVTREVLSVYYVNKDNQYLGIEVDNYLDNNNLDYELRSKWLKGFLKADFFITDRKEEFCNKIKSEFGEFGSITNNILTKEEFIDVYEKDVSLLKKKIDNNKKRILFINDFTNNEKWIPIMQNQIKDIDLDKYEVIILGDNKNPNSIEKLTSGIDKRVRILQTKGWMLIKEEDRLEYDYIMAELLYFPNLNDVLEKSSSNYVANEWKRNIGNCDIEEICLFNINNWKWLLFTNYFKNVKKEIFVDFDNIRKIDKEFYEMARENYHNYILDYDVLLFYSKYHEQKYNEEFSEGKEHKIGFDSSADNEYWTSEIVHDGQKMLVYNDFINGNRYIDVIEKPDENVDNEYFEISQELSDDDYKKIVNYIENSVGKKIYVFDYTEYYQGAFDELNIRTGNIKYYKTPLYYYLLKKYLNKVDLNK